MNVKNQSMGKIRKGHATYNNKKTFYYVSPPPIIYHGLDKTLETDECSLHGVPGANHDQLGVGITGSAVLFFSTIPTSNN